MAVAQYAYFPRVNLITAGGPFLKRNDRLSRGGHLVHFNTKRSVATR